MKVIFGRLLRSNFRYGRMCQARTGEEAGRAETLAHRR